MSMKAIATEQAPQAVGPYSQAVLSGGFLFASGQLPIDPATGKMVEGSIQDKTRQCLKNLTAVAQAGETSLANAVKLTVFLTDMGNFAAANEAYKEFFNAPFPARSAIQVAALPLGGEIEIEAIFSV